MLHEDTKVPGAKGWQRVGDTELGAFVTNARRYTFKLARGTSDKRWEIVSARPHPWHLTNGETTYDLRIGDVVKANTKDQGHNLLGWVHGFLKRKAFTEGVFKVYANSSKWIPRLRELATSSYKTGEDICIFTFPDHPWREWPYDLKDHTVDSSYISSFVRGYYEAIAGDQISVVDKSAAEWLYLHAPFGGYVSSGEIIATQKTRRVSRIAEKPWHDVYNFQCVPGREHGGFRVESLETIKTEEVLLPLRCEPTCTLGGISIIW